VAEFIGVSNTMTLSVDRREDGLVVMDLGEGSRLVAPDPGDGASEHQLTIRPERIALEDPATAGDHDCRVRGRLLEVVYLGSMSQAIVETETGERLIVHYLNDESEGSPVPGSEVSLGWAAQSSFVIGSGVGTAGNTEPEKEGSTR
jgi:spermidine/putrescine transport system ATP-binding protein